MVKHKSIRAISFAALSKELKEHDIVKKNDFDKPKLNIKEELFEQRSKQRESLFAFAKIWVSIWMGFLIFLFMIQTIMKIGIDSNFIIMDRISLNILSVSIIGQFIGIIILIAKALWNDEPYKKILEDSH